VFIHQTAIVEEGAKIGIGSKIWHFAHVRTNAELGTNVVVGKSSFIDTGVKIGNDVKIQNLVSVYNGVSIEDNVFVGPHVVFTNDLYPRAKGDWKIVKTQVKTGASLGANSTILCGITIGTNTLIAAGAVVIKDVPDHAIVAGNPARLKGYVCICAHKILSADTEPNHYKITCDNCGNTNEFDIN
jgi:acetyltransferase-like isoleucine patch superfamily enzyme